MALKSYHRKLLCNGKEEVVFRSRCINIPPFKFIQMKSFLCFERITFRKKRPLRLRKSQRFVLLFTQTPPSECNFTHCCKFSMQHSNIKFYPKRFPVSLQKATSSSELLKKKNTQEKSSAASADE